MRRPSVSLLLVLVVGLAGCFKQATDETAATTRPRYTGPAPWTINGVRPGQSIDEVTRLLGEPHETRGRAEQLTLFWSRPEVVVTFDAHGSVTEVMGTAVKAGDQTIVPASSSEAEVTQILGPGRVQQSSRPKGGGIISLGREHTGTTLIYDRDGVRFELCVFGEAAGHFLARKIAP